MRKAFHIHFAHTQNMDRGLRKFWVRHKRSTPGPSESGSKTRPIWPCSYYASLWYCLNLGHGCHTSTHGRSSRQENYQHLETIDSKIGLIAQLNVLCREPPHPPAPKLDMLVVRMWDQPKVKLDSLRDIFSGMDQTFRAD